MDCRAAQQSVSFLESRVRSWSNRAIRLHSHAHGYLRRLLSARLEKERKRQYNIDIII